MNESSQTKRFAIYIKGDELEPNYVTTALGVAPTYSHRKGDRTMTITNIPIVRNTSVWSHVVESNGSDANALLLELLTKIKVGADLKSVKGIESAYVDVYLSLSADNRGGGTCEFEFDKAAISAINALGLSINFTIAVINERGADIFIQ